jgi:predicted HTH domain antitoxin
MPVDDPFSKYFGTSDDSPNFNYLLLLLYSPMNGGQMNAPIKGKTHLHKAFFLMSKVYDDIDSSREHLFGPESPAAELAYVQCNNSNLVTEDSRNGISLSKKGIPMASKLWIQTDKPKQNFIKKIKNTINKMTVTELIDYVYSAYPESTSNSIILSKHKQTRFNSAVSLYKKKLISLERAAEIAGKTLENFIEEVDRKNIVLLE